jgi:mannose-6-phosphate isomerase-like protein (cupin superfamily)
MITSGRHRHQEFIMRIPAILALALISSLAAGDRIAAQGGAQPAKTFASAADVEAMINKARSERAPDQANFIQQIVRLAPYNVNLEYRVAGIDTPATQHETEAELVFVVDGAGTLMTGGKLTDEKRTNATNLAGREVDGGTSRRIAKGDYAFIPENTAHSFRNTEGRLVIMSFHVPRSGR